MKHLLLFLVFSCVFSFSTEVLGQEAETKEQSHIIFISDFSAKDYYTLIDTSQEIRIFEINEACIPLGLLSISYDKGYDEKQSRDYTQTIILKLISRNASYTAYTIADLRNACSEYRKDNSDE